MKHRVDRPSVTVSVKERHRPLTGTKLYCLLTEAHECEQLAQSYYLTMHRAEVEPETSRLPVWHAKPRVGGVA